MKTLRVLYHLALADFLQRARSIRFLLTLAAIIFMGVLVNNGTLSISLQPNYRGVFNSAWIGTMTVLVINTSLSLLGFYLVSDCIQRDIRTGVGQIIATTPVSRAAYLIGKWISNCLVLFVLVLIMGAAAVVMVLLQGEAPLDLGELLKPFFTFSLPYMVLIAAFAVVFETVPWLRGALGNVVYFFVWIFFIMLSLQDWKELPFLKEPIGYTVFSTSIRAEAEAAFPNETMGMMAVGSYATPGTQYKIFNWPGLDLTSGIVIGQWSWALLGLGLILLSALWFARFDPSREGLRRPRAKPEHAKESEPSELRTKARHLTLPSLSPLVYKLAQVNPFLGVLFAELRMLLKGRRWWWWAITAGLNIALLSTPFSIAKEYLLPIAWLWLLPVLSEMGNRERKNNTSQMVFSSARPVLRQLPAAWLAGILATALLEFAGAVVFLLNGDLPGLAGWVGAVIFVPTLALALGVTSSGSRAFEVVYVIWWYVGPLQKTPGLDFVSGPPQVYLLAAAGLLLLSAFWRGRQVRA